jgi:hypothetical protein
VGSAAARTLGIAEGIASQRESARIRTGLHPGAEVEALEASRARHALFSVVGYGVAAGAAVGAVLSWRAHQAKTSLSIGVVPSSQGAIAVVSGVLP